MFGLRESGGLFENCLTSIVDASHRYLGWLEQSERGLLFFYEKKKKSVMLNFWNTEDSLRKTLCSFLALCLQIFCSPNVQKSCFNL